MEQHFIIGEKTQCSQCFAFFPSDASKYCSEACKQAAADEIAIARIEFQRLFPEAA